MILQLFFIFSSSIFIPYEKTALPSILQLNEISFGNFTPTKSVLIALIIPECSFIEKQFYLNIFTQTMTLFSNVADYAYFFMEEAQSLVISIPVQPPALVFFYNGHLVFSSKLPRSEKELIFLLSSWLDPQNDVITTVNDLYGALGNLDLSLITTFENGPQASYIVTNALPYIDSCNIVLVDKKIKDELGIKTEFGLYRNHDKTIVTKMENTSIGLFHASKPFFNYLTPNIIKSKNNVFAVYIDNNFSYDDLKYQKLYNIGEKYNDFMVGVLDAKHVSCIEEVTREKLSNEPTFIVFSYNYGYYYPNEIKGIYIEDPKWMEKVDDYLSKIMNHEIKPKYYTEIIPLNQKYYITKLVGKTYKEFVEDTEHDIGVLYIDSPTNLTEYFQVAKEIYDNGTKSLRLGYINIKENSSPEHYPLFVNLPHFELFPLKNKTDSEPMFETKSKESYKRFIKQHMSLPNNIQANKISSSDAQLELFVFSMRTQRLPPRILEKAKSFYAYLDKIANQK